MEMNPATSEIDPAMTEKMIDWSNLPSDIVNLIAERVATNLDDYINFRAVCPSWRSVTVGPRHVKFPPQLPWILLGAINPNPLPFISISDFKPRFVPLPEATGKKILFSSDGWLVLEESPTKISLLNPLTSVLIHLPPLPPLPPCKNIEDKDVKMFAVATSSSSSTNSTIMAIIGQPMTLIGLQSGSSAWTLVSRFLIFEDVIYYKESFYVTTLLGHVLVFNTELKRVMWVKVPVRSYLSPWRLVESCGELLTVQKQLTSTGKTTGFDVYKLISSVEGSLQFVDVHGLGDQMIFVGNYGRAVSSSAKDHPSRTGNRIYSLEENISRSPEENCWTSLSAAMTWYEPRLC